MRSAPKAVLASIVGLALAACSSGGGSSPQPQPAPTTHVVTLSWIPNREAGVNKAGGGYRITISGQAPVDVPWTVGPLAPTSKDVTLPVTGDHGARPVGEQRKTTP
jgi:ABC-type glycerol-3-phosphate transport system substrate-binding protein